MIWGVSEEQVVARCDHADEIAQLRAEETGCGPRSQR
jgi:hypothetical protein